MGQELRATRAIVIDRRWLAFPFRSHLRTPEHAWTPRGMGVA
jgi:hypothetical protein